MDKTVWVVGLLSITALLLPAASMAQMSQGPQCPDTWEGQDRWTLSSQLTGAGPGSALATTCDYTVGTGGFGYVLGPGEPTLPLKVGNIPFLIKYIDDDGDNRFDTDEAVIASSTGVNEVVGNDLRMANPLDGQLGTQIRASDREFGIPVRDLVVQGAYFDSDGDGRWTAGDTAFLDLLNVGTPGQVSVGDIIISGPDAGTVVASGYTLLNNQVRILGEVLVYYDADGDNQWDSGDTLY
ncbi:MAG: hypothetical protein R3185_02965, partial [Candidatus Thermoplasmatota archaeon]|nr:hypothetical protein [Candidatus Thermoplasmatota archaeon]